MSWTVDGEEGCVENYVYNTGGTGGRADVCGSAVVNVLHLMFTICSSSNISVRCSQCLDINTGALRPMTQLHSLITQDNSDVIDLQHARHILISLAHKSASPALTHLVMNSYATFTSRSLIPGVSCGVYHAPSSLLRPSLSVKLSPCRSCLLLRPAGNKSHRSDSCCKQRRRVHSHKQAERKKTEEGKKNLISNLLTPATNQK